MPEALYLTVMGVTAVFALVANLGRFHKTRSLERRANALHVEMVAWAAGTDWKVSDGSEIKRVEQADRMTGLAGFPRDWDIKIGTDNRGRDIEKYAPIRKWVYGTILTRDTSYGRVMIIGCWREESTTHHVFAALSGAPHTSPFTVDMFAGNELVYDGTPPPSCTVRHIDTALAELLPPTRLRLLGGQILLHTPAWLSPEIAEDRFLRLLELCKVLPQGPALGPER